MSAENKMGAPEKEINWTQFEELCKIQCTQGEICAVMDVDHRTLSKHVEKKYGEGYMPIYNKFKEFGRMSLRRSQMMYAIKGNTALLIWLGKQYLGQKDDVIDGNEEIIDNELEIIASPNGNKEEIENRVKKYLK